MSTDQAPATDQPVVLYDTTLRDGTQGENITLSLADKIRVARMLDEYGMPFIEGGWPGSNPKDIEFFAEAKKMTWSNPQLPASGSTRHRTNAAAEDPFLNELVRAETPVVTIFGKSWTMHATEVLGASLALILLSACMLYLARPLSELLDAYGNTFEVSGLSGREVLVFLLSGGALGLLGALLAVQRYFRQFRLDSANAGE